MPYVPPPACNIFCSKRIDGMEEQSSTELTVVLTPQLRGPAAAALSFNLTNCRF